MASRDAGFAVSDAPQGPPLRVAVIGCGRIGRLHAGVIARQVPGLALAAVHDAVPAASAAVSADFGAPVMSVDEILASPDVDAVAICSSTDTHVGLIERSAAAGKAIFCEKPVSLDLPEVERAMDVVDASGVPFMIGFNRRFDPSHRAVREAVATHRIGDLHLLKITSRDPAPPPVAYIAVSGGIFLDMAIHDFDMAAYIAGSPVTEVFARGAVRVDPAIGEAGDVDTTAVVLTHADGTMTLIDNSREAVYGYDQRVEAFGSQGMAFSDNVPQYTGGLMGADGEVRATPQWFFLERYRDAYRLEWEAFRDYVREGGPSPAGTQAGRESTRAAVAARTSWQENRPVAVAEVSSAG